MSLALQNASGGNLCLGNYTLTALSEAATTFTSAATPIAS